MKNNHPTVSILTITYNQEKYIRQALESFIDQKTDFDFEIIVADDCSSDKTPEIIQEFASLHPGIFKPILRKKNVGAVANMADILRKADGKYIAVCEGDDYWTDTQKLQIQVDFLDKHAEYGGCFHTVRVIYEANVKEEFIFPEVKDKSWYTTDELLRTNYIPTNSVMYRRQKYDDIPENIMPFDWYLHLYHAQFGKIAFIDKTMSVYRKHTSGIWWDYDINRNKIWEKYGLSHLALLKAVLKIYGENSQRRIIIDGMINSLLNALLDVDKESRKSLFRDALKTYPELTDPFMLDQHSKLLQKDEVIKDLTSELLQVGEERNDAIAENGSLKYELAQSAHKLETITQSKIWRLKTKADRLRKKRNHS